MKFGTQLQSAERLSRSIVHHCSPFFRLPRLSIVYLLMTKELHRRSEVSPVKSLHRFLSDCCWSCSEQSPRPSPITVACLRVHSNGCPTDFICSSFPPFGHRPVLPPSFHATDLRLNCWSRSTPLATDKRRPSPASRVLCDSLTGFSQNELPRCPVLS